MTAVLANYRLEYANDMLHCPCMDESTSTSRCSSSKNLVAPFLRREYSEKPLSPRGMTAGVHCVVLPTTRWSQVNDENVRKVVNLLNNLYVPI